VIDTLRLGATNIQPAFNDACARTASSTLPREPAGIRASAVASVGLPGRLFTVDLDPITEGHSPPVAAFAAVGSPARPRNAMASPTAATAPATGPAMYTQR
jgi:hypothetical protein